MKLILHPGHSKCGSTSIQQTLLSNRQLLATRGYILPDDQLRLPGEPQFNPRANSPRPFFRRLMESDDVAPLRKRLSVIKQKLREGCLLISAENLVNQLRRPAGQNIHRIFRDFFDEISVIYYIKRQDAFVLSAWQQWGYKQGLNFQQYLEHCLKTGNPNYWIAASFFSTLYENRNVSVVPLHPSALLGQDLITDFFSRIGIDNGSLKLDNTASNKSLNPVLCDLLSRTPHLFRDAHDESIKGKLTKILGNDALIYARFSDFIQEGDRQAIMQRFLADNKKLHSQFFKHLDFEDLFGYKESTSSEKSAVDQKLDKIYTVLAIQNEILIKLMEKL